MSVFTGKKVNRENERMKEIYIERESEIKYEKMRYKCMCINER